MTYYVAQLDPYFEGNSEDWEILFRSEYEIVSEDSIEDDEGYMIGRRGGITKIEEIEG